MIHGSINITGTPKYLTRKPGQTLGAVKLGNSLSVVQSDC